MQRILLVLIPFTASLVWAVGHKRSEPTLFRRLPATQTGITFNNRIDESDSVNILRFEYLYNGGGVGIGDFNNDGLQDVFFTGNQVSCRLYLNNSQRPGQPLQFTDITESAGVNTHAWCTGVTVADVNQDGWQDIYVSVAGYDTDTTKRANLLFINHTQDKGKPVIFREQAHEYGLDDMGYSTQTAFFDYDHDGDLDAYVLTNALDRYNRNALRPKQTHGEAASNDRLYRNMHVEWANERMSQRTADQDSLVSPSDYSPFKNVTHEAGILTEGYGLGIAIADLNGDGWEDIYCANDFLSNDLIWVNNHDGTFTNRAAEYLRHQTHNAMGVDIADINNDQLPDIMVVDMLPNTNERQKMMLPGYNYDRFRMDVRMGYEPQYMRNTLQLNRGIKEEGRKQEKKRPGSQHTTLSLLLPSSRTPAFSDISQFAGVDKTDWSWAPLFADFDNDGYRDLLITNGYRRDVTNLDFTAYLADLHAGGFGDMQQKNAKAYKKLLELPDVKLPDFCYRNRGGEGIPSFEDVSEQWGFMAPNFSNGAAYADLDNDGDLDLVINAINDEAFVYENTLNGTDRQNVDKQSRNSWLRIGLMRNPAQGTKVTVYSGANIQTAEFNPTRGYVSSVEPYLHFGLGATTKIDSVKISWNDGQYQMLRQVKPNQVLQVVYQPVGHCQPSPTGLPSTFREVAAATIGLNCVHTESEFNDFARTPLLPHKHSQNGPPLAVADADGNGLDDLFMGADFGQKSYVYFQQTDGRFQKNELPKNADQEDTGALFFDADSDGDQDLYVVSGGSHANGLSAAYQDRLYINNGKGQFMLSASALPQIKVSGSCVVACDFDQDGDLDLFRGSRLKPGSYPMPVKSYLLRNDNGRFVDVTETLAPDLGNCGLVTSAVWGDFNKDKVQDLALCGEWMPVTVLYGRTHPGPKKEKSEGMTYTLQAPPSTIQNLPTGWWNTLVAADFDADGDLDLIAGNLGLNTKYKASAKSPMEVFAADFDKNGTIDPIMTYYSQGKRWLRPTRDLLTTQIPSMKRRFPDFQSYSKATFEESFTDDELKEAYHLSATDFRTMYFENTGAGFRMHQLPQETQLAPVYGVLVNDFNQDGHQDALLIGNSYASETIGGWCDASKGVLLLGNGKGGFKVSQPTGLNADREAKTIAQLRRKDGTTWVLIGNNGSQLQVVQVTSDIGKRVDL